MVLVLGYFSEPPNKAFSGEFGNFGVSVTFTVGFHLGGAPTEAGVTWVPCCASAGAIWLCSASLFQVKKGLWESEVISASFADIWGAGGLSE